MNLVIFVKGLLQTLFYRELTNGQAINYAVNNQCAKLKELPKILLSDLIAELVSIHKEVANAVPEPKAGISSGHVSP